MACEMASESRPRMSRVRRLLLLASGLTLIACAGVILTLRTSQSGAVAGSPYANTRPGVEYVGDSACVRCHAEIAETYRRHPMGRSLSPVEAPGRATQGPAGFEAQGLHYSVEHRGDRVIHREARRDPTGQIIAQNEAVIR